MLHITDEYDYLTELVRCTIHEITPSECPSGVMFDSVYKCGVRHDLANIAYYSVEKLSVLPEHEVLKKWRARRDSTIVRDMNQSFARDEILREFRERGICSVEVQGTVLKKLYPKSEYRTMSDIDFIVLPEKLSEAGEVLESLGYECRENRGVEIDGFRAPNIRVEVHTEFFPFNTDYYKTMPLPVDEMRKCGGSYKVTDEEFYLYNALHIAKHYFGEGCGIRRVLDLYYLNETFPDIADSDYVKSMLQSVGMYDFIRDLSLLAVQWFGKEACDPDPGLLEIVQVLKDAGVHGNVRRKVTNKIKKDGTKGKKNVKLKYVLSRIFPPKWVMIENYPILKRHFWLIPFCFIHGLFKGLTKKRKRVAE
ncbi:MAG: nucleotidyltransferase family protein, partial [Clostridia bacterium]|nr:nucleotidyltransferase family protein [Clostridia bacterium]